MVPSPERVKIPSDQLQPHGADEFHVSWVNGDEEGLYTSSVTPI